MLGGMSWQNSVKPEVESKKRDVGSRSLTVLVGWLLTFQKKKTCTIHLCMFRLELSFLTFFHFFFCAVSCVTDGRHNCLYTVKRITLKEKRSTYCLNVLRTGQYLEGNYYDILASTLNLRISGMIWGQTTRSSLRCHSRLSSSPYVGKWRVE